MISDLVLTDNQKKMINIVSGNKSNRSITVIKGNRFPGIMGWYGYYTTKGGKPISHPSSYRYPKIYHPSTCHIEVGEKWIKCHSLKKVNRSPDIYELFVNEKTTSKIFRFKDWKLSKGLYYNFASDMSLVYLKGKKIGYQLAVTNFPEILAFNFSYPEYIRLKAISDRFPPPVGFKWTVDNNHNVKIQHIALEDCDYHLSNIYTDPGIAGAIAFRNYAERLGQDEENREKELQLINLSEVTLVGLPDSVSSGNCEAGTLNWANKNNLTSTHMYLATYLREISKGKSEESRVRGAIWSAIKRQKELEFHDVL